MPAPPFIVARSGVRLCGVSCVFTRKTCALLIQFRSRRTKLRDTIMASGVQVSDEVLTCFQDMKVHKVDEVKKKRKKAVIFCLSCCQKFIVPEEGREILEEDVGDAFQQVIDMLPPNECRYALYDATYETRESKKQDLVFIFWAPECAAIKNKMLYASSKDSIKKKFTGIKHEWQVNSMEDLRDRTGFAKKLGGDSVVSLEGVAL